MKQSLTGSYRVAICKNVSVIKQLQHIIFYLVSRCPSKPIACNHCTRKNRLSLSWSTTLPA